MARLNWVSFYYGNGMDWADGKDGRNGANVGHGRECRILADGAFYGSSMAGRAHS